MFNRRIGALLASTAALALFVGEANANAFGSRSQSVVGMGQAYAGVAAPGIGLSGMFWNPAVVTSMPGRNSEWNLFALVPQIRLENLSVGSAVVGTVGIPGFLIPAVQAGIPASLNPQLAARGLPGEYGTTLMSTASYNNYQVNENLFIGLSIGAPYGSGSNPGGRWAGATDVSRQRVFSTNVQPVVGYRVSDQLSIAVGAQIQYFAITQEQTVGPGGLLAGVTGDDWGFGFTAGLSWRPLPGTSIGLGYRSSVDHRVEGDQYLYQAVGSVAPGSYKIHADITLPESVTFGIRQQITNDFALSFGAEWRNWSRLQTNPIIGSPTGSQFVLNYKDGYFYALGADFRINPNWTVRVGIAYDKTPIQDQFRTASLPDSNRIWLTLGTTYDVSNQLSISASYAYVRAESERLNRNYTLPVPVALGPGMSGIALTNVGYSADTDLSVHIFGLSARYRWQ